MRKLLIALLSLALTSSVGAQSCCDANGVYQNYGMGWQQYPPLPPSFPGGPSVSITALTANADRYHQCAPIWNEDYASHACTSAGCTISFMTGATTWASAGSTATVGLQDIDLANGPPGRGDGTFDISRDLVQGSEDITASSWNSVAMEDNAGMTVTHGKNVCFVFSLDTDNGAESLTINTPKVESAGHNTSSAQVVRESGAVFTSLLNLPNFMITYDDGKKGFPFGGAVGSAWLQQYTFNSGSAADEYGLVCKLPYGRTAIGMGGNVSQATAGGNLNFNFYFLDGAFTPTSASPLEAITQDYNQTQSVGSRGTNLLFTTSPRRYIPAGQMFAVTVSATTANNVAINYHTSDSGAVKGWAGGGNCYEISRADGSGAFTATQTTRFPEMWVLLDGAHSH